MNNEENYFDNSIVLKDIVDSYIKKWKWFVIGVVISLISTFLVLRYTTPLYKANSTIKIKDDSSNGAISELAVFEDMGMLMNQQGNVENEIAIVKSRNLLGEIVKDLKLNIQFFEKGKTFFEDISSLFSSNPLDKELYNNVPINIDFLVEDSIVLNSRANFEITLLSPTKFNFKERNSPIETEYSYGNNVSTSIGDVIITPNIEFNKDYINKTILLRVSSLRSMIDYLKYNVNIVFNKTNDIVDLNINTEVEGKGVDILNNLIGYYNADAVNEKSLISKNTSDFISNRLKVVSEELSEVDKTIEDYRRKNKIIDPASQAGLNLQNESANNQRIVETNNQLNMIEAVEDYINKQDEISVIPENLGFSNASLSNSTSKYNELVFRRNQLLKSVNDNHPAIVNLDEQIINLRGNISKSIGSIKNSHQITINSLKKQDALFSSKLFSAPKKERELTDITRQQQIKQSLYLYLLQKREEIAISLGITTVNAKIIDSAYGSGYPVFPDRKMIMLGALFLGLLIPFLILYVLDILDTKIHSRDDVEKVLKLPIVGDIPQTKKKYRVIFKEDRSGTAEAFRLVRTNLDFMLKTSSGNKVISITSTVGNEGKTFIAINLAKSLAFSDAKVLLLGLDLRAPSISKDLNIKKGIGVTNYLTDKNLSLNDIINQVNDIENLDLITSGVIPPNPAELLMSKRLENLFEEAKEKYDYIIVDTPPVSLVTDTILLDRYSDLFIYVVRAEHVDKRILKVPFNLNRDKKLKNMAILVNGLKQSNNNYGYGYGYGEDVNKPWYKKVFS